MKKYELVLDDKKEFSGRTLYGNKYKQEARQAWQDQRSQDNEKAIYI